MKRLAFCCLLLATAMLRAEDPQPKTAEQILRIVRLSYALQNHKMSGVLRDDTTRPRGADGAERWRIRSCASFSPTRRPRSSTSTSTPRPPHFIK
jgi:hypothetical protein